MGYNSISKQSPETDRIIQKYTISSDRVTITISAEANQFVRLIQFNQNQANTVLATIPVVAGSIQKVESKKQNEDTYSVTCPSAFPNLA